MARAICTTCGKERSWSNSRGSRLADHRCAECGGELRRPAATDRVARSRGEQVHCKACRRLRYSNAGNAYQVTKRHIILERGQRLAVEPGDWLCWFHSIADADGGYGRNVGELQRLGAL